MAGGSETEALLGGRQADAQPSTSATTPRGAAASEAASDDQQAILEVTAHRIVTWTLWFLLGAVLVGTVIGVVLVSLPMQGGDGPPAVRKSAGLVILQAGAKNADGTGLGSSRRRRGVDRSLLAECDNAGSGGANLTAMVWSGKGHGRGVVYGDLHFLDLTTGRWRTAFNLSAQQSIERHFPAPRWKSVALYEPKSHDVVVFGGDPLSPDGAFLNDLWRLKGPSEFGNPVWQSVAASNDSTAGVPEPRRAHAAAILDLDGTSTLFVHGGKIPGGGLLADVWSVSLDAPDADWQRRAEGPSPPDALVPTAAPEALDRRHKKRKHKKRRHVGPLARKGHVAVPVPGPAGTRVVVWGGRNDTDYFTDMWAFDLSSDTWERWDADSRAQPSGRDHLGAFYLNGSMYIYGGRGGDNYADSVPLGDMWKFDVKSRQWSEIEIQGEAPPPRFLHSMDVFGGAADASIVVFGGESLHSCYLNDAWEFSLADRRWQKRSALQADRKKCAKLG